MKSSCVSVTELFKQTTVLLQTYSKDVFRRMVVKGPMPKPIYCKFLNVWYRYVKNYFSWSFFCLVLESKFEIDLPPSLLQDIKSAGSNSVNIWQKCPIPANLRGKLLHYQVFVALKWSPSFPQFPLPPDWEDPSLIPCCPKSPSGRYSTSLLCWISSWGCLD